MALEHECHFRVGDADSDSLSTAHLDALRLESLQGSARRARGTRAAPEEQNLVLLVSNEREGR